MGVTRYLLGSECVLIVISVYFRLRLTVRTGQLLQFQIPCRNLNYPIFNYIYYSTLLLNTYFKISLRFTCAVLLGNGLTLIVVLLTFGKTDTNLSTTL